MESDLILEKNLLSWGHSKQKTIKASSILIAGMGGLGCTVAQILTRAGIGSLILVDNDRISPSDLNRQILYDTSDIGREKVVVAAEKLRLVNSESIIKTYCLTIGPENDLNDIEPDINGFADCLDNYKSRFYLNDLLRSGQFLVHGGLRNDFGQVTTIIPGKTQTLRELYRGITSRKNIPATAEIVTSIAALQATEILKNLWKEAQLINKMLILDLEDFIMEKISLKK